MNNSLILQELKERIEKEKQYLGIAETNIEQDRQNNIPAFIFEKVNHDSIFLNNNQILCASPSKEHQSRSFSKLNERNNSTSEPNKMRTPVRKILSNNPYASRKTADHTPSQGSVIKGTNILIQNCENGYVQRKNKINQLFAERKE